MRGRGPAAEKRMTSDHDGRKKKISKGAVQRAIRAANARWGPDFTRLRALRAPPTSSPEKHYTDTLEQTYNCDTTGSLVHINVIPAGSSQESRFGKKIRMISVQIRGHLSAESAVSTCLCAVLLVYDKSPGGALPNINAILESASSLALNNDDNAQRFKIVRRWETVVSGNPGAGERTSQTMIPFNQFVKLTSARDVVYKAGNTGLIGDILEGALYLITVGNQPAAGDFNAFLRATTRVRFIDI